MIRSEIVNFLPHQNQFRLAIHNKIKIDCSFFQVFVYSKASQVIPIFKHSILTAYAEFTKPDQ